MKEREGGVRERVKESGGGVREGERRRGERASERGGRGVVRARKKLREMGLER